MLRFWRSSVVLVVIPAVLGVCLLGCGGGGGGGGGTGVSISAVEGDGATPQDIATKVIVTGSGFVDGDVVEILNTDDTPNNTGCLGTTFIDANTLELAVDPDTFESGDRKVAVVRGATVMATKANGFLTGPEGPQGIQGIQGIQGLPGNAYNAGPGIIVDTVPDPDVISVDLAGTGVLDTVARSDHDHDSTYYTQAAADLLLADEMDVLDYDTVTPGDGIVDDADHAALADLATFADDADLLDGEEGAFYQNADNLNAGTVPTDRYSAYLDLQLEGYLGDAANDIALNNGTLQVQLNADRLDGQEGPYYQNANNINAGTLNVLRYSSYLDLQNEGYLGNAVDDIALNNGVLQATLNADLLDSQTGAFYQNASNLNAGTLNVLRYSAHDDLGNEGFLGNAAGDIAQNNGLVQATLNADLLDGQTGAFYQDASNINAGPLGVAYYDARAELADALHLGNAAGDIAQNNGLLQATLNADLLDGQEGSFYQNANNINAGTLNVLRYSARADLTAELHLGNAAGDIAQNNSLLQLTLNADLLDGAHGSFYRDAGNINAGLLGLAYYDARAELADAGHLANAADDIAQNNGTLQTNLNADELDGNDSTDFIMADAGQIDDALDFSFSTETWIDNLDADLLDGEEGSFYRNATNINNGTLGSAYYDARAELADAGHLANADGDIAQNNGVLQANLNAQMLDGNVSSYYRNADNINGGTLSPNRYSAYSDLSAEGHLGDAFNDIAQNNSSLQNGLNADLLDGEEGSFYQDADNINAGTLDSGYYSAADDLVDEGLLANNTDQIPQSNGVLQGSLNADLLDGEDGTFYQDASNINAGLLGVAYYDARAQLVDAGHLGNATGDIAQNNTTLQTDLNADLLDGQEGTYYQNADNIVSGTLSTDRYTAHNDLGLEGFLGNAAGDLAQNNGTLQPTLNADLLDGEEGTFYQDASNINNGSLGVAYYDARAELLDAGHLADASGDIAQNNTTLQTDLNADLLDSQTGAFYQNASNINAGNLSTDWYSAIADLGVEGFLGDANGDIAQNNGTLQATLNADQVDGKEADDLWQLDGNAGTTAGTDFIGTTDNVALEFKVSSARALRIEPALTPNLIGGYSGNAVTATAVGATIGGGGANLNVNQVTDNYGTVGGGTGNVAGDGAGTVGDAGYATVAGGLNNAAEGTGATVSGGDTNRSLDNYAAVGGGQGNTANGLHATIAGGDSNLATADNAFVGGGWSNDASETYAVIGGGYDNTASGTQSTIAGGRTNTADNGYATVCGGRTNTASGLSATVAGGDSNVALGNYSFAAGRRAKANHAGALVLADSTDADLASDRNDQLKARANGGVYLSVNNSGWVNIYDDSTDLITTSSSAHLTVGGAWTDSSDRNLKENFAQLDPEEVLRKVADLPITRWNYKKEADSVTHIGPVAQDFFAAFGVGSDNRHIASLDTAGVSLAAIKALEKRTAELKRENAELKARLAKLEAALGGLGKE